MLILKFGGSSLSSVANIKQVAQIILDKKKSHKELVVVVSAMGKETDRLSLLCSEISKTPSEERDFVLSTGELVSAGLVAKCINSMSKDKKIMASPLTSYQAEISGDGGPGQAQIKTIKKDSFQELFKQNIVPIVPGFQCIDKEGKIRTLGRGGSDTSAVVLGGLLGAKKVEIYTDVDGVYNKDPKKIHSAQKYESIDSQTMFKMASKGAQVLHPEAVKAGEKYQINIEVRTTFEPKKRGTLVFPSQKMKPTKALIKTKLLEDTAALKIQPAL